MKTVEYWKEQSKKFDESATYYDKFRPSYPKELLDTILQKTNVSTESKILEIGSGTGKATELFVNRGYNMFCIEPGENLVEVASEKPHFSQHVDFHIGRFEEWNETLNHFDLAISAQAFHWVPKPIGYQKCANTLKSQGALALFWNFYLTDNDPVDIELNKTGLFFLQSRESCEKRIQSQIKEIHSSGYFHKPSVHIFPWEKSYNTQEYIGFMKTGNAYLSLTKNEKEHAEHTVKSLLNDHGSCIVRKYLCILFISSKITQ